MESTPKPNAPDSTLLVTITVGQLRELVRNEIEAARTPQQEGPPLLTVEEAARMLSVSPDYLYRHAKKLPFARKVGPKMLRFSRQGIVKWIDTQKLS
jgi:excisionase family DNA binding protein